MKLSSYWWDIDEDLTTPMPEHMPHEVDLLVVGAGFTGLSAGLTAARQGRSVAIIDSGRPGFGASTRNGGICSGHIRIPHAVLSQRYGKDYADNVYGEGIEARADLVKFCDDEKIDCQITKAGHFNGALSQKDYDKMGHQCDALNAIPGHDVELIPRDRVHDEIKTDRFYGGLLRREIGGFHPGKFFAGLLRVVAASGAEIISRTIVEAIEDDNSSDNKDAKLVRTSRGTIRARQVIVATNGYTGTKQPFGKFLRQRVVPIQSCIIVTEKLGKKRVKELMPGMRMYGNTAKLSCYFRPVPDEDRILLGARSFDRLEPSGRSVAFLKNKLVDMLPELAHHNIDYCWLGNVAFNQRQLPAMFKEDGVYYAAGYAGSGTVWARWLGKKTAELAMGMSNQTSVFYDKPPQKIPLYDGDPWFMPFVNGYFAVQDKVNEWGYRLK